MALIRKSESAYQLCAQPPARVCLLVSGLGWFEGRSGVRCKPLALLEADIQRSSRVCCWSPILGVMWDPLPGPRPWSWWQTSSLRLGLGNNYGQLPLCERFPTHSIAPKQNNIPRNQPPPHTLLFSIRFSFTSFKFQVLRHYQDLTHTSHTPSGLEHGM